MLDSPDVRKLEESLSKNNKMSRESSDYKI